MGFGSVYRKIQEFRHPKSKLVYEQMIHRADPNASYRIRLFAQDVHHCEGDTADLYLGRQSRFSVCTRSSCEDKRLI